MTDQELFVKDALKLVGEMIGEAEVKRRINEVERYRQQLSFEAAFNTVLPQKLVDRFNWYLYTADAYLNSLGAYDFNSGARIVPTIIALGSGANSIRAIKNIKLKFEGAAQGSQDVESVFFEMLVGAAYIKEGWCVESICANRGMKTPDLHAARRGKDLFVECKRKQKNSEYSVKERQEWGRLARPLFDYLAQTRMPIILDISFHQELFSFKDKFFERDVIPKLNLYIPGTLIDDERVTIKVRPADITGLRKHLKTNYVRANTTLLNYLLYGDYDLSRGIRDLIEAKYWEGNPLYIEDVTFAAGAIWSCDAKEAINAKARDIRSDLAKAIDQFPEEGICAIHCALEMYDGEAVESERYHRIADTATQFETDRDLRWTYCHILGFSVPPDKNWDAIETVHSFGRIPGGGTTRDYMGDDFLLLTPRAFVHPQNI